MHAREALRAAWGAIRKNLLRSLLAALGIVIAVAAVVATVTALAGARAQVEQNMAGLGTNLVFIFGGSSKAKGAVGGAGTGRPLSVADGRAIGRELAPWVADVAPWVRQGTQAVAGGRNWSTTLLGTTAAYLRVRPGQVARGRFLTDADDAEGRKHCVLGSTVAEKLYGRRDPLGATVRLGSMPCTVVGVLAPKGQAGWQDQDDIVYLPFTTMTRRLVRLRGSNLVWLASARSAELTAAMELQITKLLRQRHRLSDGDANDFTLFNMHEMQQTARKEMRLLSLVMAAVAVISLVVGAIGVANVMLVSVTERTREVGLRLAVGARRRDVRRQFLVEAVLLTTLGGALGVGLGVAGSLALSHYAGWPLVLQPQVLLAALGGAGSVGIVAGFYPAWRASRLDPIEALRYE